MRLNLTNMDEANNRTIESYESGVRNYVLNTPTNREGEVEIWIKKSLEGLPFSAKILEIGSAFGLDAKTIEGMGYAVEKTDAVKGFVEILQKEDPTARVLNILTDTIEGTYDLLLANAVFLHFNKKQARSAIKKVYEALDSNGTFSFTLKEGDGSAWLEEKGIARRYYQYWSTDTIKHILNEVGFTNIDTWIDFVENGPNWIMIIAKK